MRDIDVLFRCPAKGIKHTNGIEVFLPCFCSDCFVCAGFVKGIQIMAHHSIQFFSDTCIKPLELEIFLFRMPACVDIEVNKQIKIKQDAFRFTHLYHRLHQFAISDRLHNNFAVDRIQVFGTGNHQAAVCEFVKQSGNSISGVS